jgi:hypothetical protein
MKHRKMSNSHSGYVGYGLVKKRRRLVLTNRITVYQKRVTAFMVQIRQSIGFLVRKMYMISTGTSSLKKHLSTEIEVS